MNLNDLARSAVSDLLDVSTQQAAGGLVGLQQRRRRSALVRGASAFAVLVLIAVGVGLANASKGRQVQPAEPEPAVSNGVLLGFSADENTEVKVLEGTLPAGTALDGQLSSLGAYSVGFSPDGSELRYYEPDTSGRVVESGRLVSLNLESGRRQTVWRCADDETLRCGGWAVLSPDGRRVALLTGFGNPRVEVIDLETGNVVVEPGEAAGAPVWSPDSTVLALPIPEGISIVKPGSGSRLLVPSDLQQHFVDLSWSPDGTQVAYVEPGTLGKPAGWTGFRLVVADVATGDTRALQDLGKCVCKSLLAPQVAWSPDGQLIATSTITSRSLAASGDVLVMRPNGSDVRNVGVNENFTSLVWQPVPAEEQ